MARWTAACSSQVSGCHRVASTLALWLTRSLSASFFCPPAHRWDETHLEDGETKELLLKGQASTNALHPARPVYLEAGTKSDFVLDCDAFMTQSRSSQLHLLSGHVHPGRG